MPAILEGNPFEGGSSGYRPIKPAVSATSQPCGIARKKGTENAAVPFSDPFPYCEKNTWFSSKTFPKEGLGLWVFLASELQGIRMRHRTCIVGRTAIPALFLLIIAATTSCPAAEPGRLPVPDAAAVSKSRQLIRSAYEAEYHAAMRSRDPSSLMAELEVSVETTKDPVRQYALLSEVEGLARQYNEIAKALAVIDRRARLFQEDGLKLQADMLQGLAGPKVSGDAALLDQLMYTATHAAVAERFEIATDLAKAAVSIAKSIDRSQKVARRPPEETNGPQLIKAAQELQTRLNDRKKAFTAYREAGAILEKQPDDPQANAAVGTYLCLLAQNWEKGLPYLAKSKIPWVGTLAAEETALRKATPPDPARMFLLAEKWWNAGLTKETVGGRDAIRLHAASIYSEVLPHLEDPLERRVAETRGKPFEGRAVGQRPQANEVQAAIEVFLSDLPEQDPIVGYGVFGKNGDMGFEDRKIIVGGKASPKGLSMHPPSDGMAQVTYKVPDGYTHVRGLAAIGDGTDAPSTAVIFRVMNERGDLLWESKPIDRTGTGEECNIPLRGAKSVTLAVVCPGPHHKAWAVWVDPRFVSAGGTSEGMPQSLRNSIGMQLQLIPAGTFQMGSSDREDCKPVHDVRITKSYYLGVHEVTNSQWKAVMGDAPSEWKENDRPVENVSWDNAVAFCVKLSELPQERAAGRVYRLPTEAEWEYGCRAGTATRCFFGDDLAALGDFDWFADNSGREPMAAVAVYAASPGTYWKTLADNTNQTHSVGLKKANPWGLYDMYGNVAEWCSDWYGAYADGAVTDPQGPSDGADRVVRGAGWWFGADNCASGYRFQKAATHKWKGIGFRVAMQVTSSGAAAEVFLTDLQEQNVRVHKDMFGKQGRWHNGGPIKVKDREWPKGLLLCPDSNDRSEVTYDVPMGFHTLSTLCGIADGCGGHDTGTPLTFKVLDERGGVMWTSEPLTKNGSSVKCEVRLGTAKKVTLVVECPGGCGCAHAVWLDPRFVR